MARAREAGFDPSPIIDASRQRGARGRTVWDRTKRGIRGIGAKGRALVEWMGLVVREKDELIPERTGVHYVQGGAGTGKSAALGPVATVARQKGHSVHALALATRTAREFGEKVGATGQSIDGFLARHARLLDGSASADQVAAAKADLTGSLILVDETSMIDTDRFEKLLRLANMVQTKRIVMAGDVKQLPAINAGKPFETTQKRGAETSLVEQNLRATSPVMKTVEQALSREHGGIAKALDALNDNTIETARSLALPTAVRLWSARPKAERDQALLLTLGRRMRGELNSAVQTELRAKGEIGRVAVRQRVLDRVTVTREGARQVGATRKGGSSRYGPTCRLSAFIATIAGL